MSESLAKPVRLVIEGEETQADKAIVEMLFEPLLHVVRNAMDHGVESSAERAAARKSAIATICLRARREGEHVVIEVEDDGRGIEADRIRRAAVERGLATADTVAGMSEDAVIDLIFVPAFRRRPTSPTCRGGAWAWTRCASPSNVWAGVSSSIRAPALGALCASSPLQRDDDAGDDR